MIYNTKGCHPGVHRVCVANRDCKCIQPGQQSRAQSASTVPLEDLAGWWPLTWPNHPFSLGGNFCVPLWWNNLYISKVKTTVSVRFIFKIRKLLSIYICGCWQIQSDLLKFRHSKKKMAYVRKSLQIDLTQSEKFGSEIVLGILMKTPSGGGDMKVHNLKPCYFTMPWRLMCAYVTVGLVIVV